MLYPLHLRTATLCCVLILVRTSLSQDTALQFLGQSPFTAYASRATPPGRTIYRFVAVNSTDRSPSGISYTLVQGSQSLFQIHPETGQLANLDYLPLKSFSLTVEAELNSKTIAAELTVQVFPEYTITPRFEHSSFMFATSEYTPVGTSFAVLQAFSLDPQSTVQGYSIASGNTGNDLAINATTGVLLVAHELDRERTPSYSLEIRYKESGAEIDVCVEVSVSDENDNSPEFSQQLYEASVSELDPPNTPVVSVSATDRDIGASGVVDYRIESGVDVFAIDGSSGEVTLAGDLNHEQQSMYTFTVVAEDRGLPAQTSTAIVVVMVTNEDDECPEFDSQNYAAIFPPGSTLTQNMELLTVHAVDPDSASDVMYAIVSGNELQALQLNPSTGLITLSSTTPNSYVLSIAASDESCINQSMAEAEISVATANAHSPQFQGPCVAEIEENVPAETEVTTLNAMDEDTGVYGRISYAFTEDSQLFGVDSITGGIYTTGVLDREQTANHLIGVTATDGGNRQAYCLLNITVVDENDNTPTFLAQDGYTVMLHTNSPPGTFVLQTLAEDPDTGANGAIQYLLSASDGTFEIDSNNGRIVTTTSVASMSYTFTVAASDTGQVPLESSIPVTVNVVDDSNVPAFNQSVYSRTICENLPFLTEVLQVHSHTSNGILYQLLSGSQYYMNGDGVFSIDPEGQIRVTSQGVIDYERLPQSQFQFSVSAQNTQGQISGISTIVIDVLDQDDNGPTFPSADIDANISENMPPGTLVTQLAAVDPDSGTNGEVMYSVSLGENMFEVTPNGEVLSSMPFDAESTQSSILRIMASNPNPVNSADPCPAPRQSATVVIRVSILDVNDNPPSIETTGSLTLPENVIVGTTVHTFTATDPDSSDSGLLIYTITGGNTDHSFQINNTGALSLLQALDYERMSEYTLTVQVSDGSHTDTTSLGISVTDVDDEPPEFAQTLYAGDVTENAPLGTTILRVSATDVDTPSIRYWLTGPAVGRLSISSSGDIAVIGNVDREEFPNGMMSFLAVAEGGGLTTTNVTITISDVNDYTPRFTDVDIEGVQENTDPGPSGILVGTVTAIDLDSGANGAVTYRLVQGEEDGFQIDSDTGDITAHEAYDREETPSFTLLVEAVDSGAEMQLSSTAVVQVPIGDVDDNTPYLPFTYLFARVFENAATGTEVIEIPAIDLDEGSNAVITFTFISASPGEMKYSIDSSTGIVVVRGELDYENLLHRVYNLTFSLADAPITAVLEIHLLDENDNTPVLAMPEMPLGLLISENTPVGTQVVRISATDEDTGTNAEIVFSIAGGDPGGDFRITFSDSTASIATARQLDYETTPSYDIIIEACDLGAPQRCTTTEVSLFIANVNDRSPSFSETPYTGSVVENADPVSSILQVSATDPDFGGNFDYRIESGNSDGKFALNSSSGVLSSTISLDREEQDTYVLVVTAVDSGTSPLTGTGTIIISVTDVNDNPSSDSVSQVQMVLLDGQLETGGLGHVFFSDPDSIYTFTDCSVVEIENAANLFSVDSDNCTLYLMQRNPPAGTYSLGITGNDGQNPSVFSRVSINIIHLSSSTIPLDYLVTISLAMSAGDYLDNAYTTFPTALSEALETDEDLISIISIQNGYQDSTNTVDVSFTARASDDSYLDPTYILQALYAHRDSLAASGYTLSALPADPCSSEPCLNEANCNSRTAITSSSITADSSQFLLISPVVQLDYECQCVPGTSGRDCSINYNDCYSHPCQYNAECTDGVNGFKCDCPPGTTGLDCSDTPDECSSNPCQNGATCENIPGSHTCHCVPGYYGPECQYHYFRTAPTCDSDPCQNGATCSPGRDTFTCLCPEGYSSQLCDQPVMIQGGCTGNPCYNGSTCSESPSGPVCSCSVGFTGPFCRWPVDNCELEPCQNGGTCATGLYGSYQCYCPLPYTGQDCEEFISGCESNPCQNGGRCSDTGDDGHSCECTSGYYGDNCEYSVQPQNFCSASPCLSGNCTYGHEAHTCTCSSGFSGTHCELASPPPTPCDSNPCQHGSTCVGDATDYTCLCSPGFTGSDCEINIDECDPSICQHGTCQDEINGFLCVCDSEQITGYYCDVYCPDGHSGDFCETNTVLCNTDTCQNSGTCLEGGGSYSCVCPPSHTGSTCELESSCDVVECHNGGSCSALSGGGYGCECQDGFQGPNCELITLSFTSESSYRSYQSLQLRGQGSIQFEFNTLDSEGLLLYNTQLQAGVSRDYIAVEVSGGQLVVGVSHGGNRATATVMGSAVAVDDGQWHRVTVETSGKQVSVLLDFCHELDEGVRASAGCSSTAVTQGEDSFLDLGLPLWLGGVPFVPGSSLPVSSQGITACIRDVYIGGRLLDLNSHVDEQGTQHGCPQLDNKCGSGQCGSGQCVPTWNTFLCVCPLLVTGDQCDDAAPSLTYTGSGYARYSLTEEGLRQRRQSEEGLHSTYHDQVSLSLRTTHSEGVLFYMQDESGAEFLSLQLESGEVGLHLDLGSGQESVLASGHHLNDSQRHNVSVVRSGLDITLTVDSHTTQHTLSSSELTLEINSAEIYTGGSPYTSNRLTGCLQDVRLNQFSLPTSGSKKFASITIEGGTGVVEGCSLGPCFPHPCGSGQCEETSDSSYECVCPDGSRRPSECPDTVEQSNTLAYIVGGSVLGFLLILSLLTILASVLWWQRRRRQRTYLIGTGSKAGSQELAEMFTPSQALVIHNEEGGGEADTVVADWTPLTSKRKSISQASPASSRSSSKGKKPKPPPAEKEEVDGADVRSNSPVIRAYLQERVDAAAAEIKSVDSLREYCEEGSESENESLSSIMCGLSEEEEYTLDRLRAAGPQFSSLVPLLEHVLNEGESVRDSSSEVLHTSQ